MARLRWTLDQRWHDGRRGVDITGVGVYDVPDDAVDDYLDHQSDGWEQPEGEDEEQDQEDTDEEETDESESESDSLSRDELEEMGYREIQSLAQERDIKANQSEEDLIDELVDE